MAKEIKIRSQQKNDTEANWVKATNFVPLKGEIIIYNDKKNLKIGDGTTKVNSLDFFMKEMSDDTVASIYNSISV